MSKPVDALFPFAQYLRAAAPGPQVLAAGASVDLVVPEVGFTFRLVSVNILSLVNGTRAQVIRDGVVFLDTKFRNASATSDFGAKPAYGVPFDRLTFKNADVAGDTFWPNALYFRIPVIQ